MDLGLIGGLVLGIGVILVGIITGGESPVIFIHAAGIFIVIGGAFSAVTISTGAGGVVGFFKNLRKALTTETHSPQKLIADLVNYAEVARRNGILSLESMTDGIKDKFIVRGIQMAVDGTDPEQIEEILTSEVRAMEDRHRKGRLPYELMAKYGPCFGLIATLTGQVIMLRNLSADTAAIGEGMSMAMLGTFYGATSAFLVFGPIADNLKAKDIQERYMKEIIIKGVMAIQSGDNPRAVEQRLKTLLPPLQRGADAKAADEKPARKAA